MNYLGPEYTREVMADMLLVMRQELEKRDAKITRLRALINGLECEHDGEYTVCCGWPVPREDNKSWWGLCQVCKAKEAADGQP